MSIALDHVPGTPHASTEQRAFDQARVDHDSSMVRSAAAEVNQYNEILRQLQLYAAMKAECDTDQKTALGLSVGTRAAEQWAENKPKTLAILTAISDAMGIDVPTLLADLQTATLPQEITDARVAIASA